MIVTVHFISFLVNQFFRHNFKNNHKQFLSEAHQPEEIQMCNGKDKEQNLIFDPPVYMQRYAEVQNILLNNKWKGSIKKIIDFGCAEFKLFDFIKRLYGVQEFLAVDIDEDLLTTKLNRLRPALWDFMRRRTEPLTVKVLLGSIGDPDMKLINSDAVIGIEIIEHLYPDTLDALPYNIFEFIQPKIAIFSTPNADFNVLFPNFKGFRHDDHKFEWSREQFEAWALNITQRFPKYHVSFGGVGEAPRGEMKYGCCSQIAIFVKDCDANQTSVNNGLIGNELVPASSWGVCTYCSYSKKYSPIVNQSGDNNELYKVICVEEFPYECDTRSREEKILDELKYNINTVSNVNGRFYNEEEDRFEIPLLHIVSNAYTAFTTIPEARNILKTAGFQIRECLFSNEFQPCVINERTMASSSSTPSSNKSEFDYDDEENYFQWNSHHEDSDWNAYSDTDKNDYTLTISPNVSVLQDEATCSASEIVNNLVDNLEPTKYSIQTNDISKHNSKTNGEATDLWSTVEALPPLFTIEPSNPTPEAVRGEIFETDDKTMTHEIPSRVKHNAVNGIVLRKDLQQFRENLPETSCLKKKRKSKLSENDDGNSSGLFVKNEEIELNEANALLPNHVDIPEAIDDLHVPADAAQLQELVENGDLANNNRDMEGNNYPDAREAVQDHNEDLPDGNENNNVNIGIIQPNNEDVIQNDDNQNANIENEINHVEIERRDLDGANDVNEEELAVASREVLFDPNSQPDLLEEFNTSSALNGIPNIDPSSSRALQNVVLIGINISPEDDQIGPVLPIDANPFPNWLLQLLNINSPEEPNEHHDEPHFYCQGDGIGVHPSFIEEDDSSSDSENESSNEDTGTDTVDSVTEDGSSMSSANTVHVAVDPRGGNLNPELILNNRIVPDNVDTSTDGSDEFFDTYDGSLL